MRDEKLILIGSTGRNSGKTTLAADMKRLFNEETIALKITTIHRQDAKCPRGTDGCGVCTQIEDDFEILEENHIEGKKDTQRLLLAGYDRVFWIRAQKKALLKAYLAFRQIVGNDLMVVCESNTLRKLVTPLYFVMIDNARTPKPSAEAVLSEADQIIASYVETKDPQIMHQILQKLEEKEE